MVMHASLLDSGVHFSEDAAEPSAIHVLIPRANPKTKEQLPGIPEGKPKTAPAPGPSEESGTSIDCGSLSYAKKLLALAYGRTQARLLAQEGVSVLHSPPVVSD